MIYPPRRCTIGILYVGVLPGGNKNATNVRLSVRMCQPRVLLGRQLGARRGQTFSPGPPPSERNRLSPAWPRGLSSHHKSEVTPDCAYGAVARLAGSIHSERIAAAAHYNRNL